MKEKVKIALHLIRDVLVAVAIVSSIYMLYEMVALQAFYNWKPREE